MKLISWSMSLIVEPVRPGAYTRLVWVSFGHNYRSNPVDDQNLWQNWLPFRRKPFDDIRFGADQHIEWCHGSTLVHQSDPLYRTIHITVDATEGRLYSDLWLPFQSLQSMLCLIILLNVFSHKPITRSEEQFTDHMVWCHKTIECLLLLHHLMCLFNNRECNPSREGINS